jgi:preprotein translocase subunit SecD
MTNTEIESATVSTDQTGRFVIDFTLTEKGTKIFTEYTSENVGSYLGIILDKVVLSMPQVNSPIIGGQGQITGNFDEESAGSLAAYLNIIPLPIPLVFVGGGE